MKVTFGVIGRTATDSELCDGQTVKTRVLVSELQNKYPDSEIVIADTYNYKKNPLKMVYSIINAMVKSDVVFVLLSRNGMKVIFPIINSMNIFLKKPILHDCIGGGWDTFVQRYSGIGREIKKFTVNWVESQNEKEKLNALGYDNVEYLPNFKRLNCIAEKKLKLVYPEQFRFCTFSRVNEAKGVGKACEAVIEINRELGYVKATLDIYGPIEDNYDTFINKYVEQANGAITYHGAVPSEKSVETLTDAYALLFPTTFYGEGFPGTLIDAFSSGVPIIATDWHLNGEIIQDGYTGLLYDPEQPEKLKELMEKLMADPALVFEMRKNCLAEAKKYSPDKVMDVINAKINAVCNDKA